MALFATTMPVEGAEADPPAAYVGATACRECHAPQFEAWAQSDHFQSMRPAGEGTVLGDFADARVMFHGIETRFFRRGDAYFIETIGGSGERNVYPVRYTFGWRPLQQVLVEADAGRLQAFNVAWDARPVEQGGQRWFHLQPDELIRPQHPFFWTGHALNWSSHCADCHSTNVVKTWDNDSLVAETEYAEVNVACEACHGPAGSHVRLARSDLIAAGGDAGFERAPASRVEWRLLPGERIATPLGNADGREIDMCGGCHSLRTPMVRDTLGKPYHDAYRVEIVNDAIYFADGQIREESFVLGSFLQSKMHQRGVTCGDCHDPHSGASVAEANGVCAQCHRSAAYDAKIHHGHASGTPGSECVDCHMPARTYMGVDDRRDHSFPIPRPTLSEDLGVPNACTGCHEGRTNGWAAESLRDWGKTETDHWARLYRRLRLGNPRAGSALEALIATQGTPAMVKASLLAEAGSLPSAAVPLARGLADPDALVRRGAAAGTRGLSGPVRWQLFRDRLGDVAPGVRFEVALALAEVDANLPPAVRQATRQLHAEHRRSLAVSADLAGTQHTLARLDDQLGQPAAAQRGFERALALDPTFVPTLVNYADFIHRGRGDEDEVGVLLRRALTVAPESAIVNAAFGLHLVRAGRHGEALAPLATASHAPDAGPRFIYIHAVAQHSLGHKDAALVTLRRGIERWPWDPDLLATFLIYRDDADAPESRAHLATLMEVAPDDPRTLGLRQRTGVRASDR